MVQKCSKPQHILLFDVIFALHLLGIGPAMELQILLSSDFLL